MSSPTLSDIDFKNKMAELPLILGWAAEANCCESYVVSSQKVELTGNHNGTTDYDFLLFEIGSVQYLGPIKVHEL